MKNQGLKLDNYDLTVSRSRYTPLINQFIREVFGKEYIKKYVPKYSPEEYYRVVSKLLCFRLSDMQDVRSAMYDPEFTDEDRIILLSFVKNNALDFLRKSERVFLKDDLAQHLTFRAMVIFQEEIETLWDKL